MQKPQTLARLSFQIAPQYQAQFEVLYENKLAPILKAHGLNQPMLNSRLTKSNFFIRIFQMPTAKDVINKKTAIQTDQAWQHSMKEITTKLNLERTIEYQFDIYKSPLGPGEQEKARSITGSWRSYDVTDGLPAANVSHIYQDRNGLLWFVLPGGGLTRYDGQNFTTFTKEDGLASNIVSSICQDTNGDFWIATHSGVNLFSGTTWKTFTKKDGLSSTIARALCADRAGNIWLGTDEGICRFDGTNWTTITLNDGLPEYCYRSIYQDKGGNLWFGSIGGGVSKFDGNTWKTFTTRDGLANNVVRSIYQDKEGNLWFGTLGGGVSRFDGKTWTTFTTQEGLPDNSVYAIFQDQENILWFGTDIGGLGRFDGKNWTTFTTQEGLIDNNIKAICQDREGYIWFGTDCGLCQYDGYTWLSFTSQDGPRRDLIETIYEDQGGQVWLGSRSGLTRYDGQNFTTFTQKDGLARNEVGIIFQDRAGHLWFGTDDGIVMQLNGNTLTTYAQADGLGSGTLWAIYEDRNGSLWFGTNSGVSRFDGHIFTTFTEQDGLPHNRVYAIYEDQNGHLWFGTFRGMCRYDGSTWTTFITKGWHPDNNVRSIAQDTNGRLWFATSGGIGCYQGELFTPFTTRDGLATNVVYAVLQAKDGHLWFSTQAGVCRFDGQVFQTIQQQDGLASNSVMPIIQTQDGTFWFGTNKGITRYRPSKPTQPRVFIDAVIADRRYTPNENITVPKNITLVTFELRAMSFKTRPGSMVYRYRLEGYDEAWQTTRSHRIEYQNLPQGEFTFQVQAVDRDLVYSDLAEVSLAVQPDPLTTALTEALSKSRAAGKFIGNSQALRHVQKQLASVAPTDLTILILGETGTGKGVAASYVHELSNNKAGPFIQINCGAMPEGLVESELFGHERGAFTGAVARKLGKVELAAEGTLFLDEIGDLSLEAQVKLLRLLEERIFERVGGTQTLHATVRVIAATNRNLHQMVAENQFREDLYFRLQAFPVRLPPLRERKEDIPDLATYFMHRMATHLHKNIHQLSSESIRMLQLYDWPGNVRELEHTIQRAVIVCQNGKIGPQDVSTGTEQSGLSTLSELVTLEELERRYIKEVLEKTDWVIKGPKGAAIQLGLHASTLRSRMKKLGITRTQG